MLQLKGMKWFLNLIFAFIATFALVGVVHAADVDTDGDGLSDNAETTIYATDPAVADTDGDGFSDGAEIANGYSPRSGEKTRLTDIDSDKDNLPDAWELALGTNLMNPDTDGDGFLDGTEVRAGYDPSSTDKKRLEKRISVDLSSQKLAYSVGGVVLESFPISSGLKRTPTPPGEFNILAKVPLKNYGGAGFSYPNTKWNLQFTTVKGLRYYIHGAYWHNDFGTPKSHGCVNVSYQNMERLYDWAQVGTKVEITSQDLIKTPPRPFQAGGCFLTAIYSATSNSPTPIFLKSSFLMPNDLQRISW